MAAASRGTLVGFFGEVDLVPTRTGSDLSIAYGFGIGEHLSDQQLKTDVEPSSNLPQVHARHFPSTRDCTILE